MNPSDFNGPIQQLAERAREGDESARETLPRELERCLVPMIRRWLRKRGNATPLERRITRLFGSLRDRNAIREELDHDQVANLLASYVSQLVTRRMLRGNARSDTVVERATASVYA